MIEGSRQSNEPGSLIALRFVMQFIGCAIVLCVSTLAPAMLFPEVIQADSGHVSEPFLWLWNSGSSVDIGRLPFIVLGFVFLGFALSTGLSRRHIPRVAIAVAALGMVVGGLFGALMGHGLRVQYSDCAEGGFCSVFHIQAIVNFGFLAAAAAVIAIVARRRSSLTFAIWFPIGVTLAMIVLHRLAWHLFLETHLTNLIR